MRRRFVAPAVVAVLLAFPVGCLAGDHHTLYVQVASYVHYHSSPEHKGPPILGAAELHWPDDNQFMGAALFNNSFGQFSQFVYYGWQFPLDWIHTGLHLKVPVGFIHGYRGDHQGDIPLNRFGVAPAILPGIGYKQGRWGADVVMLGTAALLFSVGYEFGD
ncbi:MAG TPA: sn-glycerol-3-phosphate transporter [Gammaproteobacteria bacterium]|nr:sn-glycerol-3-phosphate transporter [Gammaproteobacteria bacterium]